MYRTRPHVRGTLRSTYVLSERKRERESRLASEMIAEFFSPE